MMECMVTITFNDYAPEMLASARLDHENYALEHVISYQRRIAATKDAFMRRGKRTLLGTLTDWWDRSASSSHRRSIIITL